MSIEDLKQEIITAQTYYRFWNSNRHLPTSAETADYFAARLKLLETKYNEQINKQNNAGGQCRQAARAKANKTR